MHAHGVSFAFIACCSILPMGYWAEEHRPGCRPMRAWTQHRSAFGADPGAVPEVETFIHAEDRAQLIEDIARARALADHVIVSMHWGIHFVPGDIADYQSQIAHAAIDAGAALVVGHHPHVLKGIERYRDGLILYSLGNFALEGPTAFAPNLHASHGFQEIKSLARQWDAKRLLPADAHRSLMVSCEFGAGRLQRALLRPVYLRADAEPYLPQAGEPQCTEVLDYLDECCRSQRLPIPYRRGDGYAAIDF
jgi:poly-gamma-glutamate synthesis protein (capsule biosynthesis protein)